MSETPAFVPTTDERTLALIQEVTRRKQEIARLERPQWKTNCSFVFSEDGTQPINLHVESDVRKLVRMAAFIFSRAEAYGLAANLLGVDAPDFQIQGYSSEDWISDIKDRIAKIQIATKRKQLEALETRLNGLISPELRAQLELQAIEAELGL